MSFRSMTGHGRGRALRGGVAAEVEVASVNRRQRDVVVGLPPRLVSLAPRVEEEVGRSVSRGRVSVTVAVRWPAAWKQRQLQVDEDLAAASIKALRRAARRAGLPGDFSPGVLLQVPEVVQFEPPARESERAWPAIRAALAVAVKGLVRMRQREGAILRRDLEARLKKLERLLAEIRRRAPEVVARYRRQMTERLRQAGFEREAADERMLRELALFADKADVAEELTRLESHIAQARTLFLAEESAGRSLDFLAQEMFREANTIGSKANDADIAARVVSLKTELERIREQVQNIE
mgnify:CR=1 FL=1